MHTLLFYKYKFHAINKKTHAVHMRICMGANDKIILMNMHKIASTHIHSPIRSFEDLDKIKQTENANTLRMSMSLYHDNNGSSSPAHLLLWYPLVLSWRVAIYPSAQQKRNLLILSSFRFSSFSTFWNDLRGGWWHVSQITHCLNLNYYCKEVYH